MTHLLIILPNSLIDNEETSDAIILKLHDTASNGQLDQDSDLQGRLHATVAYRTPVEYLNTNYSDLHISVDNYAIPFEDPNMLSYLLSIGIGSNGKITEALAAAAYMVANSLNTTVRKFNELRYFTNITHSRGDFDVNNQGWVRFKDWTALEEIDISNFTSIGHSHWLGCDDTFWNCSNLKTVTASDKLNKIGVRSFSGCSNLEDISGLQGEIELYNYAFNDCTKLKSSCFDNCQIVLKGSAAFYGASQIQSITLSSSNTEVQSSTFESSGLTTINMNPETTTIGTLAFRRCSNLLSIDLSHILNFTGWGAFSGCSNLTGDIYMPNLVSFNDGERFFEGTNITSVSNLGSITKTGSSTFTNCVELVNVTLPSTVTSIDGGAFAFDYKLSTVNSQTAGEIDLPNITSIGVSAFRACEKILKVKCLGKTTEIQLCAFYNHGRTMLLSEVYLPYECTSIGPLAFQGCTNLTTIKQYNKSIDQYLQGESPVFNSISNVTIFDQYCFDYCTSLILTSNDITNATYIGLSAFNRTQLTGDISLPSLTEIKDGAFQGTYITRVTNLGSVTSIPSATFSDCSSLLQIVIPSSCTSVAINNFTNTLITKIIIPEGVTVVTGGQLTYDGNLYPSYIELPSTLTDLGYFFHRCLGSRPSNIAALIIKATTPPTLGYYGNETFYTDVHAFYGIYVPDASLTAYQNTGGAWVESGIQNKLKPISLLLTDNPTAWAEYLLRA